MNFIDNLNLARAQTAYDRMEPVEKVDAFKPFTDHDIFWFIQDFAECEDRPDMWLEDQGVFNSKIDIEIVLSAAEVLRDLCIAWLKDKKAVESICPSFKPTMKSLAYERFCNE